MSDAYLKVELYDATNKLLVVNNGLFRYTIVIWSGTSTSNFPEICRQSGFWHSVCGWVPGRCDRHRMDEGRTPAPSQADPRFTERVWYETASPQVWVLPITVHIPGTRDLSRWSETIRRTRHYNNQGHAVFSESKVRRALTNGVSKHSCSFIPVG